MSEQLKPCPFCGSEKVAVAGWSDCCEVLCENCMSASRVANSEEKAIAAWNRRVSGWISVEDRLPDQCGHYLVMIKTDGNIGFEVHSHLIRIVYFRSDGWRLSHHFPEWIHQALKQEITHWQPLPDLPEVKEGTDDEMR